MSLALAGLYYLCLSLIGPWAPSRLLPQFSMYRFTVLGASGLSPAVPSRAQDEGIGGTGCTCFVSLGRLRPREHSVIHCSQVNWLALAHTTLSDHALAGGGIRGEDNESVFGRYMTRNVASCLFMMLLRGPDRRAVGVYTVYTFSLPSLHPLQPISRLPTGISTSSGINVEAC